MLSFFFKIFSADFPIFEIRVLIGIVTKFSKKTAQLTCFSWNFSNVLGRKTSRRRVTPRCGIGGKR